MGVRTLDMFEEGWHPGFPGPFQFQLFSAVPKALTVGTGPPG